MNSRSAAALALLAAALFALSIPLSKYFLNDFPAVIVAAFLYLGAGLAMGGAYAWKRRVGTAGASLGREDLPYTVAMVALDILAPILLLLGVARTTSANASLLVNAEIVFTACVAAIAFKELISGKLWLAIGLIVLASAILTFEGVQAFTLNTGSLLVLGAAACWGIENNCTRMLSHKSSEQVVTVKGLGSAVGSLSIGVALGVSVPWSWEILAIVLLGAVSYGLSINVYVKAQSVLGAAKTSAYYAINPFLGVIFSMTLLGERPHLGFYIGLVVMGLATAVLVHEELKSAE